MTFFHPPPAPQVPEVENADGEYVTKGETSVLILTNGEHDKLRGKAVYFVRATPKVRAPPASSLSLSGLSTNPDRVTFVVARRRAGNAGRGRTSFPPLLCCAPARPPFVHPGALS